MLTNCREVHRNSGESVLKQLFRKVSRRPNEWTQISGNKWQGWEIHYAPNKLCKWHLEPGGNHKLAWVSSLTLVHFRLRNSTFRILINWRKFTKFGRLGNHSLKMFAPDANRDFTVNLHDVKSTKLLRLGFPSLKMFAPDANCGLTSMANPQKCWGWDFPASNLFVPGEPTNFSQHM